MADIIQGTAYVLGDDIDTDQIIPAEYLSYNPADPEERKFFGMYALSGLPTAQQGLPNGNQPFVEPDKFNSQYPIIIGGKNFGCGSSREHAPLALAEAGVKAVIAQFYARIFYRNCVNGGYLLPVESVERLCEKTTTGDQIAIDLDNQTITNQTTGQTFACKELGDVKPIIDAGGVFDYARQTGMIGSSK